MNCKPGDLAIVRRSRTGRGNHHIGKVVSIVRESRCWGIGTWETDPILYSDHGNAIDWMDEHLRPIRPSEGQDETLTWAPVPAKETA